VYRRRGGHGRGTERQSSRCEELKRRGVHIDLGDGFTPPGGERLRDRGKNLLT